MRIAQRIDLLQSGTFPETEIWQHALEEIERAISKVVWPPGNHSFVINPTRKGNGVVPIKDEFLFSLEKDGRDTNDRKNPLLIDAIKKLEDGRMAGIEWETGNISSSHRAINRLILGLKKGIIVAGGLVVPSGN